MKNRIKPEYFKQSLNGIIAHLEKGNSHTIIKEFENYIKKCSTWNNFTDYINSKYSKI